MRRTLEVGRAVLFSPNTNQELWLTILITLSQQQQLIDFEQHSVGFLLQQLSSGEIWVNHGKGMHIELSVTHGKEPLARRPLKSLISSILSAPAWEQLSFRPSCTTGLDCESGKVKLVLDRCIGDGSTQPKSPHRILSSVPAADMKPPEGIPCISLDSVHIQMDILDIRQQLRATGAKRTKVWAKKTSPPASQPRWKNGKTAKEPMSTDYELETDARAPPCGNGEVGHFFEGEDARMTRKRTLTSATVIPSDEHTAELSQNRARFEVLIDGALRLAICGGLSKSANGLKVKANSISAGLAELIPELWSPGFSLAMSTRAPLLPIISRSLERSAGARATSLSLKEKMAHLEVPPLPAPISDDARQTSNSRLDVGNITSPIARRLWLHLRRNLFKVTAPLLSFVAPDPHIMEPPDSDHSILEYAGQECERDEGLSSHEVGVY